MPATAGTHTPHSQLTVNLTASARSQNTDIQVFIFSSIHTPPSSRFDRKTKMSDQGSGLQQGQSGTSAGNECRIAGDYNTCPASSDFEYQGEFQRLAADLKCPLDSVGQSEFISAAQKGLCECDAELQDQQGVKLKDMDCDCYICPPGSRFGFAYTCTTEISGPCKSFDCFGTCNGVFNPLNLDRETFGPTEAPVTEVSAASGLTNPSMGMAVMFLALARMFW